VIRRWPLEVRVVVLCTAVVALGAGALSWSALTAFAASARIAPAITWVYPVVVDGQMAVGTAAALVLRHAPRRTRAYVWSLIIASIGVSVAGNAVHASGAVLPPAAAALASAVPAAALAASLHLLVVIVRASAQPDSRARRERVGSAAVAGPVLTRVGRQRARAAVARTRSPEPRVRLADGREVSAGHARRLRAHGVEVVRAV